MLLFPFLKKLCSKAEGIATYFWDVIIEIDSKLWSAGV